MVAVSVNPTFSPLMSAPAHFTRGVLAERVRMNREVLLRGIDVAVLQRVYAETHDGWFAEPEFCGQYIDAALAAYRATGEAEWRSRAGAVVEAIITHQRADGYLGTYHSGLEFDSFSVWNQQFTMMGLLTYFEHTGDARALQAAERCADFVRMRFLAPGGPDVIDAMNSGIQHSSILLEYLRLYHLTGRQEFLDFALFIVGRWEASSLRLISGPNRSPGMAVDAVGCQKGVEMLICYRGILALYQATGDMQYLQAVQAYWQCVRNTQIGPTGNGTIAERWWYQGNTPIALTNDLHPNENCVAVSWMQLSAALLAQSGESCYADEFEKTLYNHLLGAQAADGSDFSYYQGLIGCKVHRTPESWYSCCRYRGLKMLAHLGEWAILHSADGPVIALFADVTARVPVGETMVALCQETDYPRSGQVRITVRPDQNTAFTLRVRKPAYCPHIAVTVNGQPLADLPEAHGFLCITRAWTAGDVVELDLTLPVTVRQARIDDDYQSALIMYGPLALAIDSRYGTPVGATQVAVAGNTLPLEAQNSSPDTWTPIVRFHTPGTVSGVPTPITLVDYASAGSQQPGYDKLQVWIPVAPK